MRRAATTVLVSLVLAACGTRGDAPSVTTADGSPSPTPEEDPAGFDRSREDGGVALEVDEQDGDAPAVALPSQPPVSPAPVPSPTAAASPSAPPPAPSPTAAPSPAAPSPTPAAPPSRAHPTTEPYPVALTWDGIDVRLPSAATELVGFHQSNHDGARPLAAYDGVIPWVVMETRERDTELTGAADIVVQPDVALRAPVTGTVKRAGTYRLYCDHYDDFLVIEPDGRAGIEVKLLHIDGVQVGPGDRVEAGVTPVAPRPTILPFESQVDEHSGADDWPHVHLEVVDTSIPDRPNSNSGSDDC